jgi:hypothetical protein
MEQHLVSSGDRARPHISKPPFLGLWTINHLRPQIYPSLPTSSPSALVVHDNEDEEMTDIEDWAFMYGAPGVKPIICGVCGFEWGEHSEDEDIIGCDGGYCTNSWYHFVCVGLAEPPTSSIFISSTSCPIQMSDSC